jgi:uncharacterized damage-inducible protein DinB
VTRLREIVEYIEAARAELLAVISGLSQEDLDIRPAADQWSIGEILHHLHLIESQVARLLAKQVARAMRIGLGADGGGESLLHSLDRFAIDASPEKTAAPESVTPSRSISKDTLLEQLGRSRAELSQALGQAAVFDLSRLHFPHPVLGRLDMYQWVLYVGKHETRHRHQIERVKLAIAGH